MQARIYRPSRTAMQSGKAGTRDWVLEYVPETPPTADPLMGFTSSGDMRRQIRLKFESREAAVGYAERNGIPYRLAAESEGAVRPSAYADNFRFDRMGRWTH